MNVVWPPLLVRSPFISFNNFLVVFKHKFCSSFGEYLLYEISVLWELLLILVTVKELNKSNMPALCSLERQS